MSVVSVDQLALPFSLQGIDGRTCALNLNGGRLTLAVFFKTTCPTCQLIWPSLEKLHQTYHVAGLTVWGISQDARDLSEAFASKQGGPFPTLVDSGWRVSRAYGPEFVPTLLLIDTRGEIADSLVGFNKAGLNHLSRMIAARLDMPAALIAPPDDGNPACRPG